MSIVPWIETRSWAKTPLLFHRKERVYQSFSQTDAKVSAVFHYYQIVNGLILDWVMRTTKEAIRAPFDNWIIFSKSDFSNRVDESILEAKRVTKANLFFGVIDTTNLNNVTLKERAKCIEEVRKIAYHFFGRDISFSQLCPETYIDQLADEVSRSSIAYLRVSIGYKQNAEPLVFSKADIAKFGLKRSVVTQDPSEMSCFAYALFYVGELEARHCIFRKERSDDLLNLFNLLTEWDYFSVKQPVPGDLVVYVGSDKEPKHMGVFMAEDLVLSKPGDRTRFAYTHKLFHVGFEYGNQVIFFRKGPGLS